MKLAPKKKCPNCYLLLCRLKRKSQIIRSSSPILFIWMKKTRLELSRRGKRGSFCRRRSRKRLLRRIRTLRRLLQLTSISLCKRKSLKRNGANWAAWDPILEAKIGSKKRRKLTKFRYSLKYLGILRTSQIDQQIAPKNTKAGLEKIVEERAESSPESA